jgi:hypothetical protein
VVEFFLAPTELMLAPTASLCGVLEPSEPWPPLSRPGTEDEELAVAQERERLEVLHLLLQDCRRRRDPPARGRGAEAAGKERVWEGLVASSLVRRWRRAPLGTSGSRVGRSPSRRTTPRRVVARVGDERGS